MTVSDPIADMLNRIRNAIMVRQDSVQIPVSKMKVSIASILKKEGFIKDYEIVKGKPHRMLRVQLKYVDRNKPVISGLERVSRPGLRVYVEKAEIPRVSGGIGVAIVSTSKGLMTGSDAWRQGIGGELFCYVM